MKTKTAILLVIMVAIAISCKNHSGLNLKKEQENLREKAGNINRDFQTIRFEIDTLAVRIYHLFEIQDEILPKIDRSKYKFASNGVFMKPVDDGGSAIFVTGYYPITEDVKRVVYFTEPIDSSFIELVKKYPEIVQLYFNDKSAVNRIYPYFDVLSQYEPKMDIPGYNFYYLADLKHNPEKKSLWVNEPYVDPAGRGWMVSAIAPVYYKNELVGVPGIDVTINRIMKRYITDDPESMIMIIDNTGAIVAAQESVINLLSFPPLFEHKYVETIKQDTYRKETYNLSLSKEARVRELADEILKKKSELAKIEMNGEELIVISAFIPELSWNLIKIIR